MSKTVWVLYRSGGDLHWKEMLCYDVTSTKPESFDGLQEDDEVIMVISRFQGGDVYLEGRLQEVWG